LSNDFGKKTKVLDWMQSYIDVYTKKDKRNMVGVKKRFELFLNERKLTELTFGNLTPILIEEFIDYLESKSIGEGARSYFNRFKKMIRYAYRKKILQENILDLIERKIKGKARRKDTLSLEEIKILSNTPIKSGAVKRAFLFSCFTGLRWVDIKSLKWDSIYIDNDIMYIRQSKTQVDLSAPLNEVAKKQLGKKGKLSDLVFQLPSSNGANKTIKNWLKRAKIERKITWHNARHSFGTNLILKEVDVLTTSELMGHTTLQQVKRYVKAASELKQRATDKINIEL
jgi:integrase